MYKTTATDLHYVLVRSLLGSLLGSLPDRQSKKCCTEGFDDQAVLYFARVAEQIPTEQLIVPSSNYLDNKGLNLLL